MGVEDSKYDIEKEVELKDYRVGSNTYINVKKLKNRLRDPAL